MSEIRRPIRTLRLIAASGRDVFDDSDLSVVAGRNKSQVSFPVIQTNHIFPC